MIRWAGWAMVGVAVAGAAGSALAAPPPKPTPAEQCEAKKKEAAGAKAQCRAEEHAKEVLGQTPDFARCEAAFTKAFAKAEQEAGPGVCPTEGDTSTIETLVDVCMSDIGSALAGSPPPPASCVPGGAPGYADNGDGTITDHATGLTWEKKDDDAGIHDVGLRYSWGDAILVHVAALNSPPCFAGHCDWRLPNVKELASILDLTRSNPSVPAPFDSACAAACTVQTCSCTAPDVHWSSTSSARPNAWAWSVGFYSATFGIYSNPKYEEHAVRAVRGGL